jgi:hypothetical protein
LFGANVFEDKRVATLNAAYSNSASAPVFIRYFEVSNRQNLNTKTSMTAGSTAARVWSGWPTKRA